LFEAIDLGAVADIGARITMQCGVCSIQAAVNLLDLSIKEKNACRLIGS